LGFGIFQNQCKDKVKRPIITPLSKMLFGQCPYFTWFDEDIPEKNAKCEKKNLLLHKSQLPKSLSTIQWLLKRCIHRSFPINTNLNKRVRFSITLYKNFQFVPL
jgi:hypothetical protein